ncbi:hypothetical protein [Cohnella yongneupensis]|uniref:Single cache domain-containing protein n=1 Tax=Cohnella yongneupensis TaxID=425006 RepID=A0ABW0QTC1_9BACL
MRISTWLKIMLVVFGALFAGVFIFLSALNQSFKNESVAEQRQIAFKQLGIELVVASDYLTNEARAFVQFGEKPMRIIIGEKLTRRRRENKLLPS